MQTFAFVHNLSTQLNNNLPLPWAAKASFQALSIVHLGWWWFRKGSLYTQKKNTLPLVFGHVANHLIKIEFLRFGAKCLLVITRAEECWAQTLGLGQSYYQLYECVRGRYAQVIKPQWSKSNASSIFSATFHNSRREKVKKLKNFSVRILYCVLRIFENIGKTGMHFWDFFDALSANDEAMQEVVVNGMKWMDKVKSNQYYYINKIRASEAFVESIITYTNINYKAEDVIEGFVKGVNTTANIAKTIDRVSEAGGWAVFNLLKRSSTIAGATLGVLRFVPESAGDILNLDEL